MDRAARRRPRAQRGDLTLHCRALQVGATDNDLGGRGLAGEIMLDVGQHVHHAEVAGQVDGRVPEPHAERGRAQRQQRRRGDSAVQQRLADYSPGEACPHPGRLRMGQAPAEVGQLEPVGPGAEPGQQGRQEEQRAENGDADHHDRAEGDPGEDVDTRQEQPGERHHDG